MKKVLKLKKPFLYYFFGLVSAGLLFVIQSQSDGANKFLDSTPIVSPTNSTKETGSVVRVIDGDTVVVYINGKDETVRIIGIDTPEIKDPRKSVQCFGAEASEKTKQLLEGKTVFLESDSTQGDRDKYQRLLRFVFLPDGTDIGKTLIEEGFAHEYTYQSNPYKYQKEYLSAEKYAMENKKGLWKDGVCIELRATSSEL